MTVEQRIDDPRDQFPVGMRVLAVDDDPTCLKLLETLLRRCQYHGPFLVFLPCFGVFLYGFFFSFFVFQKLVLRFWIFILVDFDV